MLSNEIYGSVLPESARWMISKGKYDQAEALLRKIAKTNKRVFDEVAFQQLKDEQKRVRNENGSCWWSSVTLRSRR